MNEYFIYQHRYIQYSKNSRPKEQNCVDWTERLKKHWQLLLIGLCFDSDCYQGRNKGASPLSKGPTSKGREGKREVREREANRRGG